MSIYFVLGGYLSFRDETKGVILDNFHQKYADLFKLLMVLHLCL